MRITTFLLLVCVFCSHAKSTYSQDARVSIHMNNAQLNKILSEIEKQTEYLFIYNNEVNANQAVSIDASQKKVADVLNDLLKDRNISFKIEGSHIILSRKNHSELKNSEAAVQQQQPFKVSGTVLDKSGLPVIGANVQVTNSAGIGTITDMDGNFTLEVPQNATLTISYIGYQPKQVAVKNAEHLRVELLEDSQALDEVVVVGYGVQKKVNLTGSVSSVKGDELSLRPVANATQSLQGLVPGLTVNNSSSGRPGAESSLTLRGQGNLSNTANPYILVDGVEMNLSDVNPNDIENISVLKDAAASAIYGARAAYGVILVTTKKGEEGKMRVSYQGTVGWSSPTVLPDMANSYDFATYFNAACANAGVAKQYSDEKLGLLQQYIQNPAGVDAWADLKGQNNLVAAFENTAKGVGNVDYFKLHYKDAAYKQNHNLSLSGGGKLAQYYVSGGAYTEDGILRYADMDYKRFNFNASVTSQVTDWLKMKVNTKFMHSDNNTPFGTGGLSEGFYHSLARFRPTVSEVDPNGHFTELTMIPYLISTTNPGLGLSTGDQTITDTRNGWATRGFFGRINYDYKGLYLLEANGRYDGSSRFASDNRWGFFPSVSLGWNLSREAFMEKTTDVLSNLKLRASWGLLGNQSGAALYTFASTMGTQPLGNYYFQDGRDMIINAPGVVDPYTTWEKVESKNVGVDFGFLGNSLTGTFDLFQRDTKDMLGPSADLADIFGATVPNTNNARMRNKGWEVTLQYRGKIGKEVGYTVGASLSDAISEVTAYENPTGTDPQGQWYVGRKVGEIWGYRADGLIQSQAEADAYNAAYDLSYISGQKWNPGDVKYRDLNGDGKINKGNNTLADMGDVTIIGNTTPRYQYTINGSVNWKGISLSLLFQGVAKRDWSPDMGSVYFWGSGPYAQVTVFEEHLDYWREDNKDAYYPAPYTAGAGAINNFRNKTSQKTDRYMQNAAYCRLKNLTVSYDLPGAWTKKVGLSKTQVFFSGENLFTSTKLAKMFDPEAIFTGTSYTSESGKNYPMNKVISLGLIVNF
ncbi:TonB-dependent receptor [Macellibacteroides fermentans]|uniref:TonB-dependent receptor n=1 Tax=Macellibacteroides fermentans TaxID=879969 RepID=UPI00406BEB6C